MKITYLQELLQEKEDAKQNHAVLRTSDSWRTYVLARDTYYNALAKAAPALFAITQSLVTITPTNPCWECGAYGACTPNCTHGAARTTLARLEALEVRRAH